MLTKQKFMPGDFVRVLDKRWAHNPGQIGMVCHSDKGENTVVFNLDTKNGKGMVWTYPNGLLELVEFND